MAYFNGIPNAELTQLEDVFTLFGNSQSGMVNTELAREYQERLHSFYADAFSLLAGIEGLVEKAAECDGGWVIYQNVEEDDSGPVLLLPRKDALLFFCARHEGKKYPYVRIMTNEAHTCDDGVDYLVEDVSVDMDGDSQLYYGAFPQRESIGSTSAPLFGLGDEPGVLRLLLPTGGIANPKALGGLPDEKDIIPLGKYDRLSDKFYALEVAQQLLGGLSKLEPFKTSVDRF